MQTNILYSLHRLWQHLPSHRRRQFLLLLPLILSGSIAEMFNIGAAVTFIGALIAPDKLFKHPIVLKMARDLGISSPSGILLPLTLLFILATLLSGGIRMFLLKSTARLSFTTGSDLCYETYRHALYLPYQIHLERNSSTVISIITGKVDAVINTMHMVLVFINSTILIISILAILIIVNPPTALAAIASFGISYFLISSYYRSRLEKNARNISNLQTHIIKILQEGFGGIRDIILDGTQPYYSSTYQRTVLPLRQALAETTFISGSPRFVMESLGMTMIAIMAYILSRQEAGAASAIPALGAFALGAQRLLPLLQQGFQAWVTIVTSNALVLDTLEFLDLPLPKEATEPPPEALPFRNSIRFEKIGFRYTVNGPLVLDDIDLTIRKGTKVGFVGSTGSGKSTLLDLLMGLIDPTEGRILVDDIPLVGASKRAWQRTIAHVPQNIYLADATIAENIAFGMNKNEIDMVRLRTAAQQASIASFIESHPDGYDAFVGERGIRLSGGQRQRIGIARALYKQASVLVLDEATSALDNATEKDVMDAIENLDHDLTILIIAHRLSTVKQCNLIVEIGQGHVIAQGNYNNLLEKSQSFRKIANLSDHLPTGGTSKFP